ncbi:cell division protein FtsX [Oricola thermophila]|uniref:ABC transporter permease n=1 Tax=Oricola thermophila TaxID=2742145 RepID=A0A6N1VH65_9HYPH|nr:ABC transporter permease [Oricola thermophila]QKV20128.1 ABC transporter permease [Oricola thermophila]
MSETLDRTSDEAPQSPMHRREPGLRPLAPIVPRAGVASQALILVIAIMSFLACVSVGAVSLVNKSASTWQSQIAREATIQIRPAENMDMETALEDARTIAASFDGVRDARIIGLDETAALLEPWLGSGLGIEELPVPRLVVVTIDETSPPDFELLDSTIREAIPAASLDDHRAWVDRLVAMARTTTAIGLCVLALVMSALVLTVIFATRGAMAGNHAIIEVLHFVGAEAGFIARQFQMRFLFSGIWGGLIGGGAATLMFLVVGWWSARNLTTPEGEQASAFFGDFSIGPGAFAGVLAVIVLVGVLTALTTRYTVLGTLRDIDERRADPGRID